MMRSCIRPPQPPKFNRAWQGATSHVAQEDTPPHPTDSSAPPPRRQQSLLNGMDNAVTFAHGPPGEMPLAISHASSFVSRKRQWGACLSFWGSRTAKLQPSSGTWPAKTCLEGPVPGRAAQGKRTARKGDLGGGSGVFICTSA